MLTATEIKTYIYDNDYAERILYELGCGNIKNHGNYISASNPDGNNKNAINLYLNENLNCVNHTRSLTKNKRSHDIFDLISYFKDCTFPESLRWTCEVLGLDYYSQPQEVPESLQILQLLKNMASDNEQDNDIPLKPIPKKVLEYYLPYPNKMWQDEGVDLDIQKEFSVGYDVESNYITLPIFDAIGSLVGLKGRYFGEPDEYHPKFLYLAPCNKSKILYGLWENRVYIKNSNILYIFEAEKSVLKCASFGYRNCVATSGKQISKTQIELIVRTGCTPVLCMDKDVGENELLSIADMFPAGISIYAMIDRDNLMAGDKDSPCDNNIVFQKLIKNNIYKIK